MIQSYLQMLVVLEGWRMMDAMGFPKKAYMEFRVSVVLKTGQVALAKVSLDAG